MAGYAVKVGSDFEAGMSEVAAISGATGDELDALTAKAKEMGASTKFSATESAEALKYMAMAGWDTQSMLDGLPGIMNLAAASRVRYCDGCAHGFRFVCVRCRTLCRCSRKGIQLLEHQRFHDGRYIQVCGAACRSAGLQH